MDGKESLVAGIMIGYKVCCNATSINPNELTIDYRMLKDTKNFVQPGNTVNSPSSILHMKKKKWVCLAGAALICQEVKKLAGLGDNISGGGFVYHKKR